MLNVEGVESGYGSLQVLWGLSLEVGKGEIVALIGPNGAGKTTLLKSIIGILPIWKGKVIFQGKVVNTLPVKERVRLGMAYVPAERELFPYMNVEDNLLLGAYTINDENKRRDLLEHVYQLFPILRERRKQLATTLSGGEQQMLAIGRGLMSGARILMLDEPSAGLAPILVKKLLNALCDLRKEGMSILLAEQNVKRALEFADKAFVVERGKVKLSGSPNELLESTELRKAYLGA